MLTEPKKLNTFVVNFYRKVERLGLEARHDRRHAKIGKAVDFLRDRLCRGASNPKFWRPLMAMFHAGHGLGISAERAWMKSFILSKNIGNMSIQEKLDFADEMHLWAKEPMSVIKRKTDV